MHSCLAQPIHTRHSATRCQQRGVPPLVVQWLCDFGEESYDGRGAVIRYFSPRGRRELEKYIGRDVARRMSEYFRCYLVQSSKDGAVLTVGKLYRNARVHCN